MSPIAIVFLIIGYGVSIGGFWVTMKISSDYAKAQQAQGK